MDKMSKIHHLLCLIGWSINLAFAFAHWLNAVEVTPLLVILPTLVCIMHHVERLYKE